MVAADLTSDGLAGLCSKEKLQLLDTVDSLRSHGISHYISLPQIIVCGDQSSGKSSVLEAISGVSFPVRSNVCTRFPTELILRKTADPGVNVSIVPHHSRPESERARLASFQERLDTFDELPDLIERAKDVMGINTQEKAFSNDLLRVEISGPDRPHLTIVDLPGLIHSETKSQSKADVKMVKQVVQGYMKESRSVILAVVSAKNDYANQVVLKLAQKADPKGTRTLGVITKPDTLHPGSESERSFVDLARNKDVEFRLGWHVLRNRDSEKDPWDLQVRNLKEKEFFSTGSWTTLDPFNWGIETLRTRLSKVLLRQISSEIPHLISDIQFKTVSYQERLDKLGPSRATTDQQRTYLVQLGQSFQAIVKAATEGSYTDPFFGDATSAVGYQKRIRAVVQNLAIEFSADLEQKGKHIQIYKEGEQGTDPGEGLAMSKDEYIDKIVALMGRSRGRELPGMLNPMIVGDLFKEQSLPWGDMVRAHVKSIWVAARTFLRHVVEHIADSTTVDTLLELVLMPKLSEILTGVNRRTEGLLKQHEQGHPITYNHYFTNTIQEIRIELQTVQISETLKRCFGVDNLAGPHSFCAVNLDSLVQQLIVPVEPDMNRFAASEALDFLEAYYNVALKRFIDDVAVEVIETGLVSELAQIIDPVSVSRMSADELSRVAGETEASRAVRKDLEMALAVLKDGVEICQKFAGFGMLDLDEYDEAKSQGQQSSDFELVESDSNPSVEQDEDSDWDENGEESNDVLEDANPSIPLTSTESRVVPSVRPLLWEEMPEEQGVVVEEDSPQADPPIRRAVLSKKEKKMERKLEKKRKEKERINREKKTKEMDKKKLEVPASNIVCPTPTPAEPDIPLSWERGINWGTEGA